MKVLVVYDSVSPMKLTAKIGETISEVLKSKGFEVDTFFVKDVEKASLKNYDCLIVGAPTMAFGVSKGMKQFLDGLSKNDISGKLAAAFDTQLQSMMSGNAAKGIEGKLKGLGLKPITTPLIAFVEGKLRQNDWRLKEGQLEKAQGWAQTVAEMLPK